MRTNLFKKITFIVFIILFLFCNICFATENDVEKKDIAPTSENTSNANIIASYETDYKYTSSDLFLFNQNIEMSDIVDGNVFAYGSTIKITGEIYGDLFVFANELDITKDAIIHGNVFTYAKTINISGIVSDVYAMGNNFTLIDSAIIARNLYLYSNTTTLSGKVSRDAFISTSNLSFGESSEAIVKNNLHYTSKQEAQIPDGTVGGEVKFSQVETNNKNIILSSIFNIIKAIIFSFVVIMLSIWIVPKFKDRVSEIVSKKSVKAFGIGLLSFFGIIILSFILLISTYGFGLSIAVTGIALLILAYSISNTVFSMAIGKILANKFNFTKNTPFVILSLLVVLVIQLIEFIPYIGYPLTFITAIVGLGTLSINAYKRKDLVADEIKEK